MHSDGITKAARTGFPLPRWDGLLACGRTRMDSIDLFTAARTGSLSGLPAEALTMAILTARNSAGHTPLHAIARRGLLRELPSGLLTEALLATRNDSGYTIYHQAALGGHLDQIPPRAAHP